MFPVLDEIDPIILEALGVVGFGVYVLAYSLLTFGKLNSRDATYFGMNLCASSLVLIGLTASFNLASAMIQMFWIVVSIVAISLRLLRRSFCRWQMFADHDHAPRLRSNLQEVANLAS